MKLNLFKPNVTQNAKRHVMQWQTGVGFFWLSLLIIIVFFVSLTINAITLIPKFMPKDKITYVSYFYTTKKSGNYLKVGQTFVEKEIKTERQVNEVTALIIADGKYEDVILQTWQVVEKTK